MTPFMAIDGHSDCGYSEVEMLWQSAATPTPSAPQWVTVDLGTSYNNIDLLEYMPS